MAVESEEFTELGDEFALVTQTAAEAGVPGGELPRVRRGWVNAIALAAGRPAVAIDLPGHGRSDWRRDGRYEPGKLASALAEAIRSFAPRAHLVVGSGLGGRSALALHRRQPRLVPRLVLVSTLPGSVPGPAQRWPGAERFASPAEAITALAVRRPERSEPSLRREIRYELLHDRDGSWTWRHHPGNLPPAPANADGADHPGAADEALWEELGQLGPPPRSSAVTGRTRCPRPISRGCASGRRASRSSRFPVAARTSSPPSPRPLRHLTTQPPATLSLKTEPEGQR